MISIRAFTAQGYFVQRNIKIPKKSISIDSCHIRLVNRSHLGLSSEDALKAVLGVPEELDSIDVAGDDAEGIDIRSSSVHTQSVRSECVHLKRSWWWWW